MQFSFSRCRLLIQARTTLYVSFQEHEVFKSRADFLRSRVPSARYERNHDENSTDSSSRGRSMLPQGGAKIDVEHWSWKSSYANLLLSRCESCREQRSHHSRNILTTSSPRRQLFLVLVKSARTSIFASRSVVRQKLNRRFFND